MHAEILHKNNCFFNIPCHEPFATKFGIVVHHHCCVTILDSVLKVKVTIRVQILRKYLSRQYLLNYLTSLNEIWSDGASYVPECHAKSLGSYLPVQGHSAVWNPKQITFSSISPVLLKLLQPNMACWCIIMNQCFVAILNCCPQGHGHSEGWNLHGISSKAVTQWGVSCRTRQHTLFSLEVCAACCSRQIKCASMPHIFLLSTSVESYTLYKAHINTL